MSRSSLDELREKIIAEAKSNADKILKEAEEKARTLIKNAELEWRKKLEREKTRIIEEARKQAASILSEARIKYKMLVTKAKYDVLEEVFRKAHDLLRQRNFDVGQSLRNLLAEAIKYLPPETKEVKIIVSPHDRDLASKIAGSMLKEMRYTIITDNNVTGGVIVETREGIKIDNSYETRLRRAREMLTSRISKILYSR